MDLEFDISFHQVNISVTKVPWFLYFERLTATKEVLWYEESIVTCTFTHFLLVHEVCQEVCMDLSRFNISLALWKCLHGLYYKSVCLRAKCRDS